MASSEACWSLLAVPDPNPINNIKIKTWRNTWNILQWLTSSVGVTRTRYSKHGREMTTSSQITTFQSGMRFVSGIQRLKFAVSVDILVNSKSFSDWGYLTRFKHTSISGIGIGNLILHPIIGTSVGIIPTYPRGISISSTPSEVPLYLNNISNRIISIKLL